MHGKRRGPSPALSLTKNRSQTPSMRSMLGLAGAFSWSREVTTCNGCVPRPVGRCRISATRTVTFSEVPRPHPVGQRPNDRAIVPTRDESYLSAMVRPSRPHHATPRETRRLGGLVSSTCTETARQGPLSAPCTPISIATNLAFCASIS